MNRGVLKAVGVTCLVALVTIGVLYVLHHFDLVSTGAWHMGWSALTALCLLGLCVWFLLRGERIWSIPFGVGFLFQAFGTAYYAGTLTPRYGRVLAFTAGAIGIVLTVMGLFYLRRWWHDRRTERRGLLSEELAEEGVDPEELERIRENLSEQLRLLRSSGLGRNAVYELPWFLVVGRPAAGKTFAIKNSRLGLPVKKDWVKGVGGTYSCDFFFTNDMIFMDTPGRWVRNGADDGARRYWGTLLKLLKRHRGKRPLDGLLVVISIADLLGVEVDGDEPVPIPDQAANIREIIDLMHEHLGFRFPVYVAVTKSDLASGFSEFFRAIPPQRRDEIFGWSNHDPNDCNVEAMVKYGFQTVYGRIDQYRTEMLAKSGSATRNRKLFFFTEELKQVRAPLIEFAEMLFYDDPSRQTPIFRGFFFTSAVQEGSPVSKALSGVARNLGLSSTLVGEGSDEESRSYFLRDLFRHLMVGDEGLIGRTFRHRLRWRKATALGVFLPAGLALLWTLASAGSLIANRGLYREIEREVKAVEERLAELSGQDLTKDNIVDRTEALDRLTDWHERLTEPLSLRRFGMRHSAPLADEIGKLFELHFDDSVLKPVLSEARRIATESDNCYERIHVFNAAVWLASRKAFDDDGDLDGLKLLWRPDYDEREESWEVFRDSVYRQMNYRKGLNPGQFFLGRLGLTNVVSRLDQRCPSGTPIESLGNLQQSCAEEVTDRCFETFRNITSGAGRKEQFLREVGRLVVTLQRLERTEEEAGEAKRALQNLYGTRRDDPCSDRATDLLERLHESTVAPVKGLIPECQAATDPREFIQRIEIDDALAQDVDQYNRNNLECPRIDLRGLSTYSKTYLHRQCRTPVGVARTSTMPGRRAERPPSSRPPNRRSAEATSVTRTGILSSSCSFSFYESYFDQRTRWQEDFNGWADEQIDPKGIEREQRVIRTQVKSKAEEYVRKWRECLARIEVASHGRSVDNWQEVAASPEIKGLLQRPIADIRSILADANEQGPPVREVVGVLEEFQRDLEEAAESIPKYQSLIADLHRQYEGFLEREGIEQFLTAYGERDERNTLVELDKLEDESERLDVVPDLFAGLLAEARSHMTAPDLKVGAWNTFRDRFTKRLLGKFPFDRKSDVLAKAEDVMELIGRERSDLERIDAAVLIGPKTRSWYNRLKNEFAPVFFKEGSNDVRKARVSVTWTGTTSTKKHRIAEVRLGPVAEPIRLEEEGAGRPIDLELLAPQSPESWSFQAVHASKKGFAGRLFGSNYKDEVPAEAVEETGPWAAFKLVRNHVDADRSESPDGYNLTFEVPVEDGKKTEIAKVHLTVESKHLPSILALLDAAPLGPPPDDHED